MIQLRNYISILAIILSLPVFTYGQGIIIPSGSYVVQENGNLCTQYNFTNNGSFTANGGTVVFSGTTQTLNGSTVTAFNNISVSSGSTTTISTSGTTLRSILKSDGTLNAGGNITLLSTATQTALVDGSGSGTISGNVIMQRYLASAYGYKYFSSPFTSATVNEFSDEVNLSNSFPLVYKYDEDLPSNGWYHYTVSSDPLNQLYGYAVNFGTSGTPLTADMTGVVGNGSISTTLYNNNQVYTQGFNLVGNPYPSPIDWNASSGWTKTNIDDAIYFFDASNSNQYTGTYSSYINGVSSNGIANNIIPAMQAFFVHVTNGTFPVSATLGVNNNVRINNLNPTFHKTTTPTNPIIRLSLRYNSEKALSDNLVIYCDASASELYDQNMDALKLNNTDTRVPNIYSISKDYKALSINAIPYVNDTTTIIPLGIETEMDGQLTLSVQDIQNMPYGLQAYIIDRQTMQYQDVSDKKPYTILTTKGVTKNRYSLVFSRKNLADTRLLNRDLTAYYADMYLHVWLNIETGNKGSLKIFNMSGQMVANTDIDGYGEHKIHTPFSNGIYIVNFQGEDKLYTKKIFIGNE